MTAPSSYDEQTGLGTPVAQNLVPDMIAYPAQASWTVMVYMDGQHLGTARPGADAIANFLQMAGVSYPPGVHVVVELGRTGSDPAYGGWSGVREGLMQTGNVPNSNWGNLVGTDTDMGSATTLENFITFATTNFPASHYALILWDHGGGIVGVCEGNNNDIITPSELGAALAAAAGGGIHFSLSVRRLPDGNGGNRLPGGELCRLYGGIRARDTRGRLELQLPGQFDRFHFRNDLAGDIVTAYQAEYGPSGYDPTADTTCRPYNSATGRPGFGPGRRHPDFRHRDGR